MWSLVVLESEFWVQKLGTETLSVFRETHLWFGERKGK